MLDADIVNAYIGTVVTTTLGSYQAFASGVQPNIPSWQDAELAVHLVYIFGELQKNNKGTIIRPMSVSLTSN